MKKKIIVSVVALTMIGLIAFVYNYIVKENEDISTSNISDVSKKEEKRNTAKVINGIKEYVNLVNMQIDTESFEDNVGVDILGAKEQSYLDAFESDTIGAYVKIRSDMYVRIEPMPDMDFATYYYKDGKLVSYEAESTTIGGNTVYYFENDELLKKNVDGEMINNETVDEILVKSKNVYKKYIMKGQ